MELGDVMPDRLLDQIAKLAREQRGECRKCVYPEVCGRDGTCWELESHLDRLWKSERAPLVGDEPERVAVVTGEPPVKLRRIRQRPF